MDELKRIRVWLFREHGLALAVMAVAVVVLTIGWSMFSERLIDRGAHSRIALQDAARIWGGPLEQPQPKVQWRRADAATVELEPGELAGSDIDVDLNIDYRRRGVVELPGYEAAFKGAYGFVNPSAAPSFVAFSIGLPADRAALMLRDVRLLIDGHEDAAQTEYAADRIVWRGRVEGSKTARFQLAYRARGLGRFGYRLVEPAPADGSAAAGPARPVSAFKLAIRANNLRGEMDYPIGSMTPTSVTWVEGARVYNWEVDRLLTAFDVGVVLPDRRDLESALDRLIHHAPWFYLLFAGSLLFALADASRRARALHLLGLSAAYFLYFPLASYLSSYLAWPVAAAASLSGVAALALLHVSSSVGARAALRTMMALLFFLATPAVAYLVPAHAGLILVLAGFCILAVALHYLGQFARRLGPDDKFEKQVGTCVQS